MPSNCRTARPGLPVLRDDDVIAGFPFGRAAGSVQAGAARVEPATALRDELLRALLRPPCVIAFSGGRDSSLLLAVATALAEEESIDKPIAHTLHYRDDPGAAEEEWQELVFTHLAELGLRPERTGTVVTGQLDIIGPLTAPVLRRHRGPVYPPALAPTILLTRLARGGCLVTGNLGDEVLASHRAAVLEAVWRRRARGMERSDWAAAGFAAAPRLLREHLVRRDDDGHPWLRPPQRRRVAALNAHAIADEPLRWNRSVRSAPATRAVSIGTATRELIAAENDCVLIEPFGASAFVESWARLGGWRGGPTRMGAIRMLGGSLLPDELLARRSKAVFNRSRFGPATREFAGTCDGSGVDDAAVDAALLRREWMSELPTRRQRPAPAASLARPARWARVTKVRMVLETARAAFWIRNPSCTLSFSEPEVTSRSTQSDQGDKAGTLMAGSGYGGRS